MIVKEPFVGDILAYIYKREEGLDRSEFVLMIDQMLAQVKDQVHDLSFEEMSAGMLESLYKIRIKAFQLMETNHISIFEVREAINQEIEEHLSNETWSRLHKAYVLSLDVMNNVMDAWIKKQKLEGDEPFKVDFANLDSIYSLLSAVNNQSLSHQELSYIQFLLDESLKSEFGIFLISFLLDGKIDLSEDQMNELIIFLLNSIERYGALAILGKLWDPGEDDERQLIQNMQILAASYSLQYT